MNKSGPGPLKYFTKTWYKHGQKEQAVCCILLNWQVADMPFKTSWGTKMADSLSCSYLTQKKKYVYTNMQQPFTDLLLRSCFMC